jgi:hypothetical protein
VYGDGGLAAPALLAHDGDSLHIMAS